MRNTACESHFTVKPTMKYCSKDSVRFDDSCIKLVWIIKHLFGNYKCMPAVQRAWKLLRAVSSQLFPGFLIGASKVVTFNRYLGTHLQPGQENFPGGICIINVVLNTINPKENLFMCSNTVLVSALYVCDGIADCGGNNNDDESKILCKYGQDESFSDVSGIKGTCGPLFKINKTGHCAVHSTTIRMKEKPFTVQDALSILYACRNGTPIYTTLFNDLVPDCPFQQDDEPQLLSMLQKNSFYTCTERHQIPCRDGHSRCYNLSQICRYTLSDQGYLTPCRTGEHLKNCKEMECSTMFKCQFSYCIHWKYTCDGKLDCPFGSDESASHLCGLQRSCENLFRCRNTQMCLHFADIYDRTGDCLLQDDEHLCVLKNISCPFGCECLTFASLCRNMTVSKSKKCAFLHFNIISIFKSVVHVAFALTDCRKLIVSKSEFSAISFCDLLKFDSSLQVISAPSNNFKRVVSSCFHSAPSAAIIDLHKNKLTTLPVALFKDLLLLKCLNLSGNPIQTIWKGTFVNLPCLTTLSLLNTNITSADKTVFIKLMLRYLETQSSLLCCLTKNQSICSTPLPWHQTCNDIFGNSAVKVVVACVCFVSLALNVIPMILQYLSFDRKHGKGTEKTSAFSVVAASVHFSDLIGILPILLTWAVDQAHLGNFLVVENKWRSSVFCFIILGLYVFYSVLSPQVLCLFTYTRFSVVDHPMDTKFKETKFVLRWITGLFLSCLLTSSIFTILVWIID